MSIHKGRRDPGPVHFVKDVTNPQRQMDVFVFANVVGINWVEFLSRVFSVTLGLQLFP